MYGLIKLKLTCKKVHNLTIRLMSTYVSNLHKEFQHITFEFIWINECDNFLNFLKSSYKIKTVTFLSNQNICI